MTTLTDLPQRLAAGTSLQLRRAFPTHKPADGWAYQLAMRIQGYTAKDGTPDGDGYTLTLTGDDTATWLPGTYAYSERMVKAGVVHEVGAGVITITENLGTAGDGRSHNQKAVEMLQAHIEGRLVDGINNYSIGGRVVSKMSLAEAVALLDKYKVKLLMERTGGNLGSVLFTFGGTK